MAGKVVNSGASERKMQDSGVEQQLARKGLP